MSCGFIDFLKDFVDFFEDSRGRKVGAKSATKVGDLVARFSGPLNH